MNWSQRMNLAIEYIEKNLIGVLSVDDVAKVACCSKYHFHRMFFAAFNITCAEYIRRRKFTLAAADLINTDKKIIDIALTYGYESPNAFTRAFRQVHQVNPSEVRSKTVRLRAYNKVFFPKDNIGGEKMDYSIVQIPQFRVLGKSKYFDFDDFVKNGAKFWKAYVASEDYQKLCSLNDGRPGEITGAPLLSVYLPKEGSKKHEFIDLLGIEATHEMDVDDFEIHSVSTATYAEFNCTYKTSMKTNRYIYGEWFSSGGFERDGSKPDIVAYFPIPFRPMGEMRVRWWIPVRPKQ